MKVRESIDIAATPEQVWPLLVDPQRMADWHAKLQAVERRGRGPVTVGERFGTTYVMSNEKGDPQEVETEVLRCEPWTTIAFRHWPNSAEPGKYVDETFQLSPRAGGAQTRVEQTIDFGRSGIPWWVRAIMWFITRFGESRGEGILEPLRRASEGVRGPAKS